MGTGSTRRERLRLSLLLYLSPSLLIIHLQPPPSSFVVHLSSWAKITIKTQREEEAQRRTTQDTTLVLLSHSHHHLLLSSSCFPPLLSSSSSSSFFFFCLLLSSSLVGSRRTDGAEPAAVAEPQQLLRRRLHARAVLPRSHRRAKQHQRARVRGSGRGGRVRGRGGRAELRYQPLHGRPAAARWGRGRLASPRRGVKVDQVTKSVRLQKNKRAGPETLVLDNVPVQVCTESARTRTRWWAVERAACFVCMFCTIFLLSCLFSVLQLGGFGAFSSSFSETKKPGLTSLFWQ